MLLIMPVLYILCTSTLQVNTVTETVVKPKRNNRSSANNIKTVLLWTTPGEEKDFLFNSYGYETFQGCQFSNCYMTYNKSFRGIDEFDAIMFFIPTASRHSKEIVPEKRSPHQRYIFMNLETPVHFKGRQTQYVFNNFYNWTISYRFDSDIPRRHGCFRKMRTGYKVPTVNAIKKKKKNIAWFVSDCTTPGKREDLVRKISKHMKVDIYGKCGNMTCPKKDNACFKMLERDYKFYLSFENSHCKDYSTEKLFGILKLNVIPIVYGGGDYNSVAPPNSVINVENFPSVKSLVAYLQFLSSHEEEYLKYFEWKKYYRIDPYTRNTACMLCEKLNGNSQKTYEDIEKWWFDAKYSGCKLENDLPKIVL